MLPITVYGRSDVLPFNVIIFCCCYSFQNVVKTQSSEMSQTPGLALNSHLKKHSLLYFLQSTSKALNRYYKFYPYA